MGMVPRERFVPHAEQASAYEDHPLPIGFEQTISQPYTVAFMCQALQLRGDEKVLEIGTGSGYGAAVLAELAAEVHTVERIPELAESARRRLEDLGIVNVYVHLGDGTEGLPNDSPFDAIVVTAGGNVLPKPYLSQLCPGGRILIPLGRQGGSQTMWRFTLRGQSVTQEDLGRFSFVPLRGGASERR